MNHKLETWLAAFLVALAALASALLVVGILQATTAHAWRPTGFNAEAAYAPGHAVETTSANYPNCRFGVGGGVIGYDVAGLNVGWHLDFGAQLNPSHPNGAEYIQVIDLKPALNGYAFTPPTSTLYQIMDQNPGSTWLVGNEPDGPLVDNLYPETYARAYHDLYYLIKQHDPTARVGIAAIIQPTPLRFQYLDRVWNAYQQYYSEPLSTDLWNTHSYILREIDPSDPQAYPNGPYFVWGAYIPPGIAVTRGILYNESDMFSLSIFRQRLLDLRTWMADHGQRDKPLYITEYGELFQYPPYMPPNDPDPYVDENGVPITEARVATFMTGTFGILQTASDSRVGYPADANQLVQRWLWFSTNYSGYGGMLFDPNTHQRSQLGNVFYTYTHAISPEVDLSAVRVLADPSVLDDTGQPEIVTLTALISNIGNISISVPITVAFYAGQPPSGTFIGAQAITSSLSGCAATAQVGVTWVISGAGPHPMYAMVDPAGAIAEVNRANNTATGMALIATEHSYLPIIAKNYTGQ